MELDQDLSLIIKGNLVKDLSPPYLFTFSATQSSSRNSSARNHFHFFMYVVIVKLQATPSLLLHVLRKMLQVSSVTFISKDLAITTCMSIIGLLSK